MLRVQKQPLPPKHIDLRSIYPLILSLQEQEMAGTGNMLRVDAVYGDDELANRSPFMNAYRTVGAALTQAGTLASASLGITVLVMPGIYNQVRFTIPNYVSLMGICRETVKLQNTMTTTGNYVTMGTNTALSSLTLSVSVSYTGTTAPFAAINFPGQTSTNSTVYNVDATITDTAGAGAMNLYGALFDATQTFTKTGFFRNITINESTLQATGRSGSTGLARGVYVTGASQIRIADSIIFASGVATTIRGVETTEGEALCELRNCTVRGTTSDTTQVSSATTGPSLRIGFSDLANDTTNGTGFEMIQPSSVLTYGVRSSAAGIPSGSALAHFLQPGLVTHGNLPSTGFNLYFPNRTVLINANIVCQTPLTGTDSIAVNLFQSGALITTLTCNAANQRAAGLNSRTFVSNSTDFLRVTLTTTLTAAYTDNVIITLSFY